MALGDGVNWDETLPADTTVASNIDDYNRDLRIGIADRLGKEHIEPATASAGGEHKWITLQAQTSAPTLEIPDTQIAGVYAKLVDTKHELFFKNKALQETQLTSDGEVNVTTFLTGMIMLWSGAVVDIPDGWLLCDGNLSTPDLRGKFVVGAGDAYTPADTGGADTHTLSEAEMPAHDHDFQGWSSYAAGGPEGGGQTTSHVTLTTASTGGGAAHENRPPYYALCYIMKS